MRERTGRVTIPTNLDIVPETIELMKRWGADAIRDCDGTEFPKDLSPYALVVHCGGCTLPLQEMRYRISYGDSQKVAITNYGVMIAYIHGILPRVTETFVDKKR